MMLMASAPLLLLLFADKDARCCRWRGITIVDMMPMRVAAQEHITHIAARRYVTLDIIDIDMLRQRGDMMVWRERRC